MAVKYRLFSNGNLSIAGNKITTEAAWDDTALVDDTHLLDDDHVFNDNDEFSDFISYLFGISSTNVAVNRVAVDKYGNLIAPTINESASLGGVLFRINNDKSISLAGVVTEEVTF